MRPVWTDAVPAGLKSGDTNCGRQPRIATLPLTTSSSPGRSRRSTKRRPNQIASALPVSSASWAITRCGRRPNPGSTFTSVTRTFADCFSSATRSPSGRRSLKSS